MNHTLFTVAMCSPIRARASLPASSASSRSVRPSRRRLLISIPYRKPERTGNTVRGIIPVLDVQFGNVWSNIPKSLFDELHLALGAPVRVRIYHDDRLVDEDIAPYRRTFGEVAVGKPLVYVNSLLNLAVALNQASYAASHRIDSGPDWSLELSSGE